MYEMIMFYNKLMTCMSMSTTIGRSLRVVFNYYLTYVSITMHHVIALLYRYALAIVCDMILTLRWRSKCHAGDDGDHEVALEMEIKRTI